MDSIRPIAMLTTAGLIAAVLCPLAVRVQGQSTPCHADPDYAVQAELIPEKGKKPNAVEEISAGSGVYKVGGMVSSPVILKNTETDFGSETRKVAYQGHCLISVSKIPTRFR